MDNIPSLDLSRLALLETQPSQTKTYTYKKSYVTKSGEVRFCNQKVVANVSGSKRGRPPKIKKVAPPNDDEKKDLSESKST